MIETGISNLKFISSAGDNPGSANIDPERVKKIISFINENLSNSDLNVEMIANAVGISRVHLYRKLKDLTNQSASDLIKNIRLQQAADLLKSKQISVSEVAYAVGFSNLSTFSTNFKNLHGESPKKFQDKHKIIQ